MEIIMIVAAISAMYQIAEMSNESGRLWGLLTLLASIVSLVVIPLPLIRVFIAFVVMFALLTIYRIVADR